MTRVLIIDNSDLATAQLEEILISLGHTVAGRTASGAAAVREAKNLSPEIVLMDISIPDSPDDSETTHIIRDELNIPIIFLTKYDDERSIERIGEIEADGYLIKPVRSLDLKAVIEIALAKKKSTTRLGDLYREVVEKTNDLIYVVDGRGNLIYVNDRILDLGGFTREAALGKSFASFLTPDSITYAAEIFKRQAKGEDVGSFELEIIGKSGNTHVIEMRERLVWKNGRVVEVYGIGRNVTDRKKAEEALKRSEEKYRSVVQNAREGIIIVQDQKIVYANPFAKRVMGLSDDDLSSRSYLEFIHPDDRKAIAERRLRFLRERELPEPHDYRVINKDGRILWVRGTTVSMTWEGNPAALAFISDITERKLAQDEILYLKQLNENIIDNMIDAIDIVNDDYIIIYQNKAALKKFGNGIGRKCYSFYNKRENPCDYCMAGKAAHERKCFSREVLMDDGTYLEVHSSPIKMQDGTYCSMEIMRDITERKKAETALQESELKYRTLVENAQEGIIVLQDDVIKFLNPRTLDVSGYTLEEIQSRPFLELVHPDDRQKIIERYTQELAGNDVSTPNSYRIIIKDGTLLWVEGVGVSIIWEGRPASLTFMTDITERKEAQEALLEREERYRALYEDNPSMYFTVSTDGTVLSVNPYGAEQLGYTVDELLGGQVLSVFHDADRTAVSEQLAACLENPGRVARWEFRKVHKNGSIMWVREAARAVRQADGRPVVLIVCEDITEQKKAERALIESEAKFRGVFETSRDFMYITSLKGEILELSLSSKIFFGYSDEEVKNMNISQFYAYAEDRKKLTDKLKAEGYVENYELKLKKKDGTLVDALTNVALRRDSEGTVIGYQGSVKDITQIKRLENQLLQAEKLSGLGTMISGAAHELNNPLTAIMGNAELLLMDKTIAKKHIKSLEVIFKESERAARIVNSLLTFAREHKQERRMTDINELILELYKLREYNLRVSNIETVLSLSDGLPESFVDPYQLHRVFTNIINNARDALTEKNGGTLTIRSFYRDSYVIVVFEDDGPGIQKENLKKIFDPFFTTKDVGKGTGLGLSMAYGIINEHGGKIEIESEPDRGARFIVSIPVVRSTPEKKELIEDNTMMNEGKRILIIDDEVYLRELLSRALSERGYSPETTSSGEGAIELLGKQKFDAIISDIKMPGIDGKELYAYILNTYPDIAKKIIFITGDTLSEDTQTFIRITENKYISKPFKIEQLITTLNQLLESDH